jgi:hypothetical protein
MRRNRVRMMPKMMKMTEMTRERRKKSQMIRIRTTMKKSNNPVRSRRKTINQNRKVTKSPVARMKTRLKRMRTGK